ncbi:hypothetical protein ABT369_51025 [Dactylosporangium sp. NPDC000244]|uniref:hypothetical protein n=1 Tax=Dactylosporangium sp. NPDC000244 TaxID=3154365 RepID=UPI003319C4C8
MGRRRLLAHQDGGASVVQDMREPVGAELLAAIGGRPVDALVNNAGVGAPGRPLAECDSLDGPELDW